VSEPVNDGDTKWCRACAGLSKRRHTCTVDGRPFVEDTRAAPLVPPIACCCARKPCECAHGKAAKYGADWWATMPVDDQILDAIVAAAEQARTIGGMQPDIVYVAPSLVRAVAYADGWAQWGGPR
jgi:hypothetical protein